VKENEILLRGQAFRPDELLGVPGECVEGRFHLVPVHHFPPHGLGQGDPGVDYLYLHDVPVLEGEVGVLDDPLGDVEPGPGFFVVFDLGDGYFTHAYATGKY